jgi:non-ribosomal peptide synthase protein (TIGR01720 family)
MYLEKKARLATSESANLIAGEERKENDLIFPRTEVEQFLVAVWLELLRQPEVGINDNFFVLGGHSLLATELVAKIYHQFRVELSVQKVFEAPTVFSLAKEIEIALRNMPQSNRPAEERITQKITPVAGVVPLTPGQAWFFTLWDGLIQPDWYNITRLLEVDGNFDSDKLKEALSYLWRIHDSLRARFIRRGKRWKQIIAGTDQGSPDYREYNLEDVPVGVEERIIEEYAQSLHGSINITQGPLMITAYLNFGPKRPGRLLLIVHHLLIDGNSMTTLVKDLQIAYRQLREGKSFASPEKSLSIKEWTELLHEYVLSDRHLQTIDYWLSLPWDEVPNLPIDYPQNCGQDFINSIAAVSMVLTTEETAVLIRKVPLVLNLEVENVLLWALNKVITEWTGSRLAEISMVGNGHELIPDQKYLDLSRTLGWIASFRILVLENIKSDDLLREVTLFCEQIKKVPDNGYGYHLAAYLNDDDRVADLLQRIRKDEILFNYRGLIDQVNDESDGLKLVRLSCGYNRNPQNVRFNNFNIIGYIRNNCLTIDWQYSYNLFRNETVERLAGKQIHILKDLVSKLEN